VNTDCKLIWESYELLTELAVSKANVQRLIAKHGIDEAATTAAETGVKGKPESETGIIDNEAEKLGYIVAWHGSSNKLVVPDTGKERTKAWSSSTGLAVHLSTSKSEAARYFEEGGTLEKYYISGKIAEVVMDEKTARIVLNGVVIFSVKRSEAKMVLDPSGKGLVVDPTQIWPTVEQITPATKKFLEDNGIDGLKFQWSTDVEYAILNKKNIKTESEIRSLLDKAR